MTEQATMEDTATKELAFLYSAARLQAWADRYEEAGAHALAAHCRAAVALHEDDTMSCGCASGYESDEATGLAGYPDGNGERW